MLIRRRATAPWRSFGPLAAATIALAHSTVCLAQNADTANPSVQKVEVTGNSDVERRVASAAKVIVTHESLVRFGDATLADALQRVSGVSVVRTQGKDAELRLRGLGNGYTQILLNGEPVAAGFSIESLSPDLVDRIEILRSATADMSTQAIAGTINIILKKADRAPRRTLKWTQSEYDGRVSGNGAADFSDRSGPWSYGASLAGGVARDIWPSTSVETASDPDTHAPLFSRTTSTLERNRQLTFSVSPQLAWKTSDATNLDLTGLLQTRHTDYGDADRRFDVSGTPPDFASDAMAATDSTSLARLALEWKTRLANEARLESKASVSWNERILDAGLDGLDADDALLLRRSVHSAMSDRTAVVTGKYSLGVADEHTLAVGWDAQDGRRDERRIQHETSPTDFPTLDLDEDYTAQVTRVALFAQDEWDVTRRLSAYLGLRWEALRTSVAGTGLDRIANDSRVLSPTLQMTWKIPDTKSDQIRLSASRTYRPPTAKQLIPRRWVVNDNSATTPNFQGNPALLPELAWGIDAGYERYLGDNGFIGLNAYARRIGNVVLERIYEDGGTWIDTPQNAGVAQAMGLEFESKGKLAALIDGAPDIDLRFDATRNWSRIRSIPGPGSRLTRQPRASITAGADWHPSGGRYALGMSMAFERGGLARTSAQETVAGSDKRLLDLYARWNIDKQASLRLTLGNLLAPDARTHTRYTSDSIDEEDDALAPSFVTVRLQLEIKL